MGESRQDTKRLLRARLRRARNGLDPEVARRLTVSACARAAELAELRAATELVAYAACDGELDPATLVASAATLGRAVYHPVLGGDVLEFRRSLPRDLAPGAHGVPEPAAGGLLAGSGIGAVLLVPGVAFDATGGRLGRGGGHYDRALVRFPAAVRIGLAFELQLVDAVPRDPWDVDMDYVVTEARVIAAHAAHARRKEMRA